MIHRLAAACGGMRRLAAAFGLASLLLVIVVAAHYLPDNVASTYAQPVQIGAANAWTKVFGHGETMMLWLIVWSLVPHRPVSARIACAVVCAWGAAEHLSAMLCRLQFDMTRPPPSPELYKGMCDTVTGLPIYMGTMIVVLLIFALNYTRKA